MVIAVGLIGAVVGLLFVLKLSRDVTWGWISLLLANWFNYTFGISQGILGRFHLDLIDLVLIALFLAGLLRFAYRWREGSTSQTLTVVYAALFLFSFVRGMASYGVNAAGNESRGLIASLIGMTYFFTIPRDQALVARFLRYYCYYAAALFVVGLLAYAGLPVGAIAWNHGDTGGMEDRLLPSPAAAAIAFSFIILTCWTTHRSSESANSSANSSAKWMRWMAPLFLAMAVLLRTRTVWMMLIAMVAAIPLVDPKLFKKLVPTVVVGLVATLGLGAAFYANTGGVSQQLEHSAQDSGTWEWRVEGWRHLVLESGNTLTTMLIGKSTGGGYWRFESNTGFYVNYPPHSEYVSEYLCTGVGGLLAIVLLLLRPIFIFACMGKRRAAMIFPSPSTWCLVCVGAVVFGITYSLPSDMWALVGMANALLLERKQTSPSRRLGAVKQLAPVSARDLLGEAG